MNKMPPYTTKAIRKLATQCLLYLIFFISTRLALAMRMRKEIGESNEDAF